MNFPDSYSLIIYCWQLIVLNSVSESMGIIGNIMITMAGLPPHMSNSRAIFPPKTCSKICWSEIICSIIVLAVNGVQ